MDLTMVSLLDSKEKKAMKFKILSLSALLIMLLTQKAFGMVYQPLPRELKVQVDDVALYVRSVGNLESRNVLVAINGGPGQSSHYMVSLEQLAGKDFAVVTYDQRGTGRSTTPSGGYTLLDHVADIEAIRKAIGAEKVHTMGHSWGGIIAMFYATAHPQRVDSILLVGSGPPSKKMSLPGQARLAQRIRELMQQGIIPKNLPPNISELLEAILPAYFSNPSYKIPDELKRTSIRANTNQMTLSAVGDWDFTAEVAKLDHRVLMLWGEDDPFGLPMAEATKSALSAAKVGFVLLKKCGHYWHECLNEFLPHVRAFLKPRPGPELSVAKELQGVLDNGLKKYNGKGISVAVIAPGHKTWVGVSGVSHGKIPIKMDTLFDAGSITKNFVAALTLKLVEEDLLTLDDPLHKWLPDYPNIDNTITIRQLLNHTSGLYSLQGPSAIRPILKDPGRLWTSKEVLTTLVGKPHFLKGKGWQYSNTGYILLGMIIENATRSKISTELRNRFWKPLGLDSMFFAVDEALPVNIAHGWFDLNGDKVLDDISVLPRTAYHSAFKGAGGIFSTSEGLAKWTYALFQERIVVSKGSLKQMIAFHSPVPKPALAGYGLGIERFTPRIFNGLELWGHAGNSLGYSAFMWYLPDYSASIALITNREQNDEFYLWFINDLLSVICSNLKKVP